MDKNLQTDKTNGRIRDDSNLESIKKAIIHEEHTTKKYLTTHEEPECSSKRERLVFDNRNTNKSISSSSNRTFCNKPLYRNSGERFLVKDVDYSLRVKGIALTSRSGLNCVQRHQNIKMSAESDPPLRCQPPLNTNRCKGIIGHGYSSKSRTDSNKIANMITSNDKLHEDKSTYCRPVLNYYNQQFIYKSMERNARLKNLVRKLSIARQREKEKVNWRNYINELKNKHRFSRENLLLVQEYIAPDIIEDCYNTTFSWEQSTLCKNLLRDFYGAHDTLQPKMFHEQASQNSKYLALDTNSYRYPSPSVGRLIVLRRDQSKSLVQTKEHKNTLSSNGKNVSALDHRPCLYSQYDKYHNVKDLKSSLVQVDNQSCPQFIRKNKGTSKRNDLVKEVSIETNKDYEYKQLDFENNQNDSLANIENKLEYLIETFNSFMSQIKSHKRSEGDTKGKLVSYKNTEKKNRISNLARNLSVDLTDKKINEVPGLTMNGSEGIVTVSDITMKRTLQNKINEILKEDSCYKLDSENEHNNNNSRAVQISIEVPTKDCCTAITNSLSEQDCEYENVILEEIITPERENDRPIQRIAIAVNTDPLSFLSLLRFSSDTLKRLLSYVPNFDYLSYLSSLHLMQRERANETHNVCKICGADFDSPSKLNDHIQGHNTLYKTRDCCVCRHVIERSSAGPFTCQYCGLQFTRAYCCELHQNSCAKRLGQCHDVTSSLMLLR